MESDKTVVPHSDVKFYARRAYTTQVSTETGRAVRFLVGPSILFKMWGFGIYTNLTLVSTFTGL